MDRLDNPVTWAILLCVIFLCIGIWIGRQAPRPRTREDMVDLYWLDCMQHINALREAEGWEVKLYCDNPDFDSSMPDCVVSVYGEWRSGSGWYWCDEEFRGRTVLECLSAALTRREADLAAQASELARIGKA